MQKYMCAKGQVPGARELRGYKATPYGSSFSVDKRIILNENDSLVSCEL